MKKAILILVLGLLVSCVSPSAYLNPDGAVQVVVDKAANSTAAEIEAEANIICQSENRGYALNKKKHSEDAFWVWYDFDCDKTQKEIADEKKQAEEKENQIKITSLINKAKDTCKTLGFKEDTEKFSDCALKLYTQSVELAAKQNQQIVSQGLGSNVVTIYDPVRDSAAAIKRGQGLINGTCTLGNLSGC
jgi:uncharacterized protein YcfL